MLSSFFCVLVKAGKLQMSIVILDAFGQNLSRVQASGVGRLQQANIMFAITPKCVRDLIRCEGITSDCTV